ncbi:hypothetical protein [Thermobrachium celere]|uniref:Rod shape-determining protein MreD n=1 Tax=Thermobrachium celere DSM 8682 TaxID=941824 RepID=R7RUR9_9CLOT|nr:hypothetical protein [Thermobrachium celere]CDF59218.1 hypothetical protein TCEL_02286 [Thermobrachium celere DSM 8682]
MDKSKRIAYSGIAAALTIISLYLGLISVKGKITFLSLSSYILAIPIIVSNIYTGLLVALASDILAFYLIPNKVYVLVFIPMSFYPSVKAYLESRIKFNWVFKYIYFNLSIIAVYNVYKFFISKDIVIGYYYLFLIAAQLFFYIYDVVFTKFIGWVINKLGL